MLESTPTDWEPSAATGPSKPAYAVGLRSGGPTMTQPSYHAIEWHSPQTCRPERCGRFRPARTGTPSLRDVPRGGMEFGSP